MGWRSDTEKQEGHGKEQKTNGKIKLLEYNETKSRKEYCWWTSAEKKNKRHNKWHFKWE